MPHSASPACCSRSAWSGIFTTSLEATIDTRVAETVPERVTAGMGWAGAVRALGSATAVASAPAVIATAGLGAGSAFAGILLATVALLTVVRIAVIRGLGRSGTPEAAGAARSRS